MSAPDSVANWLVQLRRGDASAAQRLWDRYFPRMVALARRRLHGAGRREADEEDVALSAFHSLCQGAVQGRFPRLADRDDLWQLLVVITVRKAADLMQREGRLKRGGGRLRGESALLGPPAAALTDVGLEQVVGNEPTPAFAAEVAEECGRLFEQLEDPGLRVLALLKMEGYTNEESSRHLDCALTTVERRLRLIRKVWEGESAS